MSTLWWITVCALACLAGFIGGVVYSETCRYRRRVYDLDFSRRRVGL